MRLNLHGRCLEGEVDGEPTRATGTCPQVTSPGHPGGLCACFPHHSQGEGDAPCLVTMNYFLRLVVLFGLGYEVEAALLKCAVVRKPDCAEMDSPGYNLADDTSSRISSIFN